MACWCYYRQTICTGRVKTIENLNIGWNKQFPNIPFTNSLGIHIPEYNLNKFIGYSTTKSCVLRHQWSIKIKEEIYLTWEWSKM